MENPEIVETPGEKSDQEVVDMSKLLALKQLLNCQKCSKFPRPGTKLHLCHGSCFKLFCETCSNIYKKNNVNCCPICQAAKPNGCWYTSTIPVISALTSVFTFHPCIYAKNGCTEEIHVEKLKAHEEFCIYQMVQCPSLSCTNTVVFKNVDEHLNEIHSKILDKSGHQLDQGFALNFDVNSSDLTTKILCITAYRHQFYPQFYKSGNLLYLRVVMVGHEFDVSPFEFVITFFLGNIPYKQVQWVDHVQPILREKSLLTTGDQCAIFSLKKITEYFDPETNQYKVHPNVRFSLEIFSPKLDEIAKDKESSGVNLESGLEDSDVDEETKNDFNEEDSSIDNSTEQIKQK